MFFFFAVYTVVYLTFFPHEFAQLAVWVLVTTLTMPDVVFELALVYLSVCPDELSPSVFKVTVVFTFENVTIYAFPSSSALSFSLEKLAFVSTAVFPFVCSLTMEAAILELTNITVTIDQLLSAMTLLDSLQNFSLIPKTLFIDDGCLSSLFTGYKVTNILGPFFINMFAKTMRFSIFPLALISHVIIWLFRITWE